MRILRFVCALALAGFALLANRTTLLADNSWTADTGGQVPYGASNLGSDYPVTAGLTSCRAKFASPGKQLGLHPGKIRTKDGIHPTFTGCHIGYGGYEYEIKDYDVLTMPVRWVAAQGGQLPYGETLIQGGYEGREDGGQPLYVCRSTQQEYPGIQLGKIRNGFGGCLFSYGGRELSASRYDVAVRP